MSASKQPKNGMSNARVQQIIFSTQHDFQTCFDTKKCLPAIDDFNNLQA